MRRSWQKVKSSFYSTFSGLAKGSKKGSTNIIIIIFILQKPPSTKWSKFLFWVFVLPSTILLIKPLIIEIWKKGSEILATECVITEICLHPGGFNSLIFFLAPFAPIFATLHFHPSSFRLCCFCLHLKDLTFDFGHRVGFVDGCLLE